MISLRAFITLVSNGNTTTITYKIEITSISLQINYYPTCAQHRSVGSLSKGAM